MPTISIEGGCVQLGDTLWEYRWGDVDGEHRVQFSSVGKPKIGDKIVDGALVPLIGYKINGDTSRWQEQRDEEWPVFKHT